MIFLINIYCSQFRGCQDGEKPSLMQISSFLQYYCYSTLLSGNIWQKLEPESKPKINNFGSATLQLMRNQSSVSKNFFSLFCLCKSRTRLPPRGRPYSAFQLRWHSERRLWETKDTTSVCQSRRRVTGPEENGIVRRVDCKERECAREAEKKGRKVGDKVFGEIFPKAPSVVHLCAPLQPPPFPSNILS